MRTLAQRRRRQLVALVVDDEPLVRRLVATVLTRLEWQVVQASNGAAALVLAKDEVVDLLVTDHQMPIVNGAQLAGLLRQRSPDVSIVMISGRAAGGEVAAAYGYHFLAKPFSVEELSSLLESIREERLALLGRRLGLPRAGSEKASRIEAGGQE
jgi:CheY-like chemotaxis protein